MGTEVGTGLGWRWRWAGGGDGGGDENRNGGVNGVGMHKGEDPGARQAFRSETLTHLCPRTPRTCPRQRQAGITRCGNEHAGA